MTSALETPPGYAPHDASTLARYLAGLPAVRGSLGGEPQEWRVEEVGDGNLNLVFIVRGAAGGVAVKQALPYVRLVGESWPLPLSRAHYEHLALTQANRLAPGRAPALLHYDETLALIVMELLEPHIILRRGMVDGIEYPLVTEHLADYMAATLYGTSDLALPAAEKKALVAAFAGNTALCAITEDLVFTEPYMVAENNRWTTPQLDADAAALREDAALKAAVSELKLRFMSDGQALLHGDLHTGSVMVTASDTRVIDPEFAFVGPMGFDTGALVANLLINYFAQDGHSQPQSPRAEYQRWVLEQLVEVWTQFDRAFRARWSAARTGDAFPPALLADGSAAFVEAQGRYMRRLFEDTLGFAGCKMIRRVVGLAHNIDLEWIEDPDRRAACERRVIALARRLILERGGISDMASVADMARSAETAHGGRE